MSLRRALVRPALALVIVSLAAVPPSCRSWRLRRRCRCSKGQPSIAEGNVYFTDILMQRIMRFSKDGKFSIFREKSNIANGLVIDLQGRLVAAEGAASPTAERNGMTTGGIPRVTRTDLKTGKVEILADTFDGKPLVRPERRHHRRQGPALLHGFDGWRGVPHRRAWQGGPNPRALQTSSGRMASRSHRTIAPSMSSKPTALRVGRG